MNRIHEALDSCLSAMRAGANLEACLGMYPDLADELRPTLEAAVAAMALASETIPAAAAARSRSRFIARAKGLSPRRPSPPARIPRFALTALAALLAVFLGGGGLLVASAAALPGDALYGLKRTAEDLRLRLASPSARAELEDQFNERRAGEIWALFSLGRVTPVTFEGVLTSQTRDVWVVGGIPVHLNSETDVEGAIAPGRTVEVSGTTEAGGEIHAQAILLRGFELTGVVEEIDERDWIIGGQSVFVPSDARVDPGITPGARVTAQLRVDDDGEYFAHSITLLEPARSPATPSPAPVRTDEPEEGEETDFEGSVESISSSSWVVSGVLVLIDDQTELEGDPNLGDTVRVEGVLQPGGAILAERIRTLEDETLETEEPAAASPSSTPAPDQEEDEQADRVEFEGNVNSIGSGLWVIDGQAVIVTSETEIEGEPLVGDRVRVRATRASDGSLVAERIEADH